MKDGKTGAAFAPSLVFGDATARVREPQPWQASVVRTPWVVMPARGRVPGAVWRYNWRLDRLPTDDRPALSPGGASP